MKSNYDDVINLLIITKRAALHDELLDYVQVLELAIEMMMRRGGCGSCVAGCGGVA